MTSPTSLWRMYDSPSAPSSTWASSQTALRMTAYPRLSLRWSRSANGRAVKYTAASGSMSSSSVAKYSPSSRVFSSLLLVARIASPVRANASMDELALLDLVGGRSGDRFASVVPVEGQRDVLPAALGLDVFDRITVALPDVGVEGVALFVLGGRVPGLSLRQVFLADILLGTGAAECRRIEAGCAFRRHPLRAAWRQAIVCAVERDLFDREGLTADRRLELEVALRLGLVDQGTVAGKRHGGPVIRDLSRHLEVRVFQVGLLRFGQHFLRARRRRRCGNAARSGQEAGRRRQHDEPACQLSPAPLVTLAAVRS